VKLGLFALPLCLVLNVPIKKKNSLISVCELWIVFIQLKVWLEEETVMSTIINTEPSIKICMSTLDIV
jgi:hypothetical protein